MITIKRNKGFQIVAFIPYRFFVEKYGVSIYDEKGNRIGLFATEKEAVNYLKDHYINRKRVKNEKS